MKYIRIKQIKTNLLKCVIKQYEEKKTDKKEDKRKKRCDCGKK